MWRTFPALTIINEVPATIVVGGKKLFSVLPVPWLEAFGFRDSRANLHAVSKGQRESIIVDINDVVFRTLLCRQDTKLNRLTRAPGLRCRPCLDASVRVSLTNSKIFRFQHRVCPAQPAKAPKAMKRQKVCVVRIVGTTSFVVECCADNRYDILSVK